MFDVSSFFHKPGHGNLKIHKKIGEFAQTEHQLQHSA